MEYNEALKLLEENPENNKYLLELSKEAKEALFHRASVLHVAGTIKKPTLVDLIRHALAIQLSE